MSDIHKFLRRLGIFLLPFILVEIGIALVDPFDLFDHPDWIPDEAKFAVIKNDPESMPFNYALWRMIEFRRRPNPNVFIGDSRAAALDYNYIEEVGGEKYFNFGIPGGDYPSAFGTFWFVVAHVKPQRVYIGLSFHTYNARLRHNPLAEPKTILKFPPRYFTNGHVLRASWQVVVSRFRGLESKRRDPRELADYLLDAQVRGYKNYKYPQSYCEELKRIGDYCRAQGIQLNFIIFPASPESQALITSCGMAAAQEQFRRDVAIAAPVYDFNFQNEMTRNSENFADPNHAMPFVMRRIVDDVWGGRNAWVRMYGIHNTQTNGVPLPTGPDVKTGSR